MAKPLISSVMMRDLPDSAPSKPSCSNRHLFRRVIEPRREYGFEITPKRIVLHATLPDDVGRNRVDALDVRNAPKRRRREPPRRSGGGFSVKAPDPNGPDRR